MPTGPQLVDRAGGHHLPLIDDPHPVAQPLDELELVAREDDGEACVRLLAEDGAHHVDGDRIEPGERLVENEDVRAEDEGRRKLDALLVAEAERLQLVVAPLAEAEALQPAPGGCHGVRVRHAVEFTQVAQLLGQAHLGVEAACLGHVADPPATVERDGRPVDPDLARVGREDPEHDAHRRRLARAVAADEPEQLAGADLEAQVTERDDLAVAFREPVDLEHRASLVVAANAPGGRIR